MRALAMAILQAQFQVAVEPAGDDVHENRETWEPLDVSLR